LRKSAAQRCGGGSVKTPFVRGVIEAGYSLEPPISRRKHSVFWTCIKVSGKASIQARSRKHAIMPPGPGETVRVEHDERKGALAYLAALDVRRAKVFGRCETTSGIVPVHLPVHASWLNHIEIYFSIVQRVVEEFRPLVESLVRGDDRAGFLVSHRHELVEEIALVAAYRSIAHVIDHDQARFVASCPCGDDHTCGHSFFGPRGSLPSDPATAQGPVLSRDIDTPGVAFRSSDGVSAPNVRTFAAQYPAYTLPCQRFACSLTAARA